MVAVDSMKLKFFFLLSMPIKRNIMKNLLTHYDHDQLWQFKHINFHCYHRYGSSSKSLAEMKWLAERERGRERNEQIYEPNRDDRARSTTDSNSLVDRNL